jgi:DNA polymerase/3'-5' exonuclease PolX
MKTRFPRLDALGVAMELYNALFIVTKRCAVAGSLRRLKSEVGDVEMLYIPRKVTEPDGFFFAKPVDLAEKQLDGLTRIGVLEQRRNGKGFTTWGPKIKLAIHTRTGIPVDFFAATHTNWWNYLVCRTGSAANNIKICQATQAKGWKWHPYESGFTNERGETVPVSSERDIFDLVGLPYREPSER